jgi:hypothetical protein
MRKTALPVLLALLTSPVFAAAPNDLVPPGAQHLKHSVQNQTVTEYDSALTPLGVDAFYRKAFAKRGWKPGDSVNYGTTIVLTLSKPPHGVARVTIVPKGYGATHVTLVMAE